jgi:hypothetical protein
MLGDIILFLKRVLKQHIFCIHNYKPHVVGIEERLFYQCTKCGRIVEEEP